MPDARARGAAGILAIFGALFTGNLIVLAAGYLVTLTLAWRSRILPQHAKFLIGAMIPIAVLLFFVWGAVVGAPPGSQVGTDRPGALLFALTILLRLTVLGGITQLMFLTLAPEKFPAAFSRCGIRGEGLIVALGTLALLPELMHRTDQVLTARFALGAMPNRSFLVRAREFPHMLRPLLAWSLRSAVQRSESWHQRQVFANVARFSTDSEPTSMPASVFVVALSILWVGAGIAVRFMR